MKRALSFKEWFLLLTVLIVGASSISYAQTNTFPSSGNAGIGTTSPSHRLTVKTGNVVVEDTGHRYLLRDNSGTLFRLVVGKKKG